MVIVGEAPIDAGAALERFSSGRTSSGAIVSFTGLCRSESHGNIVDGLYLDAYPALTARVIEAIEAEARSRFVVDDVLIHHRHGDIGSGEPIVFVAVASAHRRAAFDAADYLMDQLKTRAPFWKKERRPGGDAWIEPTADDTVRAAAWNMEQDG